MIRRGRRGGWAALLAAILLTMAARPARAQDLSCGTGDVEVMRLSFQGNRAFAKGVLEDGIATEPSSFLRRTLGILGARRCLDHQEFALDRVRLIVFYRNHGYASVAVDTIVTPMGKGKVGVRFTIREGEPTIVDSLSFTGLDSVPERAVIVRGLPTRKGKPFDKYANDTTRELMTQRLHNGGYPDAEVFIGYSTQTASRLASVTFTVSTGERMHLGPLIVKVEPRANASRVVKDGAIRKIASLSEGDLYSQRELERAKQALYQTQAFSRVAVIPDSVRVKGDTIIPVTVQLTEGYMHDTHAGVGYGTLDCFRTTADYTDYSVAGTATRLDLHGRVSKIGVGEPLSGLGDLCPQARNDLYSKDLNYFAGATITRPAVFRGVVPSFSLYSERRSEYDAYLRTTPVGGNVTFIRPLGLVTQAFGYSVEYGRTEAQPALLCAVFNACDAGDQVSLQRLQRLAVASFSIERNGSDNPVNPRHGSVLRLEFRTAGAYTGSDPSLHFNKILADGSVYIAASRDVVLAARLRFGAVLGSDFGFASSAVFIPQQERLFAGGQTTVRGYQQNELGPAVYIPAAYDTVHADGSHATLTVPGETVYFRASSSAGSQRTVPTGGNALAVGMLEARIRSPFLPTLLEWALFIDGGAVWNVGKADESIGFNSLRWTPGFGVRVHTGFGALRLDIAYNPYRPPIGAAYYDAPVASGGALYCVSPTNTLPVTVVGSSVQQAAGACPASFQPPLQSAWYRRFAFVLTLGEAF
jgi:outer membrane protein insertion porin family/translocation and assembly module TamA